MKKQAAILLLVIACIFAAGMAGRAPAQKVGMQAKDFTLPDMDGNNVKLSSYFGKKIVLLAFFTTDCPACKEEMPYLQEYYLEYKGKNVEVVAVDLGDSREDVAARIREGKLTFKVLRDKNGDVGTQYLVHYIPSIFLLDKDGTIAYKALFTPIDKLRSETNKLIK